MVYILFVLTIWSRHPEAPGGFEGARKNAFSLRAFSAPTSQLSEALQYFFWAFASETSSVHVLPNSLHQPWVDILVTALFALSVQVPEEKFLQLQPFPIYLLSTRNFTQLLWCLLHFCDQPGKFLVLMGHLVAGDANTFVMPQTKRTRHRHFYDLEPNRQRRCVYLQKASHLWTKHDCAVFKRQ